MANQDAPKEVSPEVRLLQRSGINLQRKNGGGRFEPFRGNPTNHGFGVRPRDDQHVTVSNICCGTGLRVGDDTVHTGRNAPVEFGSEIVVGDSVFKITR